MYPNDVLNKQSLLAAVKKITKNLVKECKKVKAGFTKTRRGKIVLNKTGLKLVASLTGLAKLARFAELARIWSGLLVVLL